MVEQSCSRYQQLYQAEESQSPGVGLRPGSPMGHGSLAFSSHHPCPTALTLSESRNKRTVPGTTLTNNSRTRPIVLGSDKVDKCQICIAFLCGVGNLRSYPCPKISRVVGETDRVITAKELSNTKRRRWTSGFDHWEEEPPT